MSTMILVPLIHGPSSFPNDTGMSILPMSSAYHSTNCIL